MSDSKLSQNDKTVKHLRRLEIQLNNLTSIYRDQKVEDFTQYIHNLRLEKTQKAVNHSP